MNEGLERFALSVKADTIIRLLTEIRNLLQGPVATVGEDDGACPHPEEQRISLQAMRDGGEHWQCGVCTFVQRPHGSKE